ncbi:hypothetical protein DYB26_016298 [Aphanomyces astaci]|uniref:Ricin B lectin domain-containing protein n=1 Tax=Aphanomyces astaci TaxID=112090 RepID=A0A418CUL2_APHAT|nr:hypothetical protein DYB26_016298 [Aphanomyces astaci]
MKSIAYFAAALSLVGSAVPASADEFDEFNEVNDFDDFNDVNDFDEVYAWHFYSAQEVYDFDEFNEVNDLDEVYAWRFYSAQDYPLSEGNSNLFANVKTDSINEWWLYNKHTRQLQSRSNVHNCLDAYPKDGKYWVHTWPCDGANRNQHWDVDFANHRIKHATHPNVCLDADPTAPQRQVQMWECHSHDVNKNQYWSVNEETVHFKRNGLYLTNTERSDIVGNISFAGLLREDEWHQERDQEWDYNRDFHQVRSDDDDYCLDAYQPWNGGRVHTWKCSHTNKNQKWQYDVYTNQLRHLTHNGYCLDINDETGARPHLWECHPPTDNFYSLQKFDLLQTTSTFD